MWRVIATASSILGTCVRDRTSPMCHRRVERVSIMPPSLASGLRAKNSRTDQLTWISALRGFAFSDFITFTVNTPSRYCAFTWLASASSGNVKLRIKLP